MFFLLFLHMRERRMFRSPVLILNYYSIFMLFDYSELFFTMFVHLSHYLKIARLCFFHKFFCAVKRIKYMMTKAVEPNQNTNKSKKTRKNECFFLLGLFDIFL